MRKISFAGIELTSQSVRGFVVPLSYRGDRPCSKNFLVKLPLVSRKLLGQNFPRLGVFKLFFPEQIFRKNFPVTPFLTRNFFQETLGLEGSKISWGKKNEGIFRKHFLAQNFLRKFWLEFSQPSPKFPGDKRKFYEEIFGLLDNRTEISTLSQYWMMPTAVRTHNCVLCCTHACIESHKRCPKSLAERAWQDCCTRWNDN